jgi:hypothetical protein
MSDESVVGAREVIPVPAAPTAKWLGDAIRACLVRVTKATETAVSTRAMEASGPATVTIEVKVWVPAKPRATTPPVPPPPPPPAAPAR